MGFLLRWKLRKAKRDMDNYLIEEIKNAYGEAFIKYTRFALLLAGEDSISLYNRLIHEREW